MSENKFEIALRNKLRKSRLSENEKSQLIGELDILSNMIIDAYIKGKEPEET